MKIAFNQKEHYAIFKALLHLQWKQAGAESAMKKLLEAHPEWQRFVDRKKAEDRRIAEFSHRVLGTHLPGEGASK